eukprot:CAMPEP_0172313604 /NCGR_PEP_ID=MMETSP1058-20130122/20562_1 /TAXON_ID=83371 /ORGANISM="Detonula confervacea, Strain CCMP 353" /LENGTH=234 /DNA_ID=CAMNT_0013027285 /DNA_START=44 /DNA_END=751 /DNA_ORIENTATION=-
MSAQLAATLLPKASSKQEEAITPSFTMRIAESKSEALDKAKELQCLLEAGGLPSLPNNSVSNAMKGNRYNDYSIEIRPYQKKKWYCIDYDTANHMIHQCSNPISFGIVGNYEQRRRDQRDKAAIPMDHFCSFDLNYLKKYKLDSIEQSPNSPNPNLSPSTPSRAPAKNNTSVPQSFPSSDVEVQEWIDNQGHRVRGCNPLIDEVQYLNMLFMVTTCHFYEFSTMFGLLVLAQSE